jgi:hypothetical protein
MEIPNALLSAPEYAHPAGAVHGQEKIHSGIPDFLEGFHRAYSE